MATNLDPQNICEILKNNKIDSTKLVLNMEQLQR